MTRKILPFYATHSDCAGLIHGVQEEFALKMIKAGHVDSVVPEQFNSATQMQVMCSYLVATSETEVAARAIQQRDGSIRYVVDQLGNPGTIAVDMGGLKSGASRLFAGQLGTTHSDTLAQALYKSFEKHTRKLFVKVKSYHVGPEAYEMLKRGMRLSPTEKSSEDYDLRL